MSFSTNPEAGFKIVDSFLPSQDRTPLSSGSAIDTAIRLVDSGVDLTEVAEADLDDNPDLFEYALGYTLGSHRRAGAAVPAEKVARRLPEAFRINIAIALRTVMSAATGQELAGPVRKVETTDELLASAQAELSTEAGRARTKGLLQLIADELRKEDPGQPDLDADYRSAQLGGVSQRFPADNSGRPNKEVRREQLMGHTGARLGALAAANAEAAKVIRTMLVDQLDPASLRLSKPD